MAHTPAARPPALPRASDRASRSGPIEVVHPGGRVLFEPGEDDRHGAAPDRFMTHVRNPTANASPIQALALEALVMTVARCRIKTSGRGGWRAAR
jgi:hypothetical protein